MSFAFFLQKSAPNLIDVKKQSRFMSQPRVPVLPWSPPHPSPPPWLQEGTGAAFGGGQKQVGTQRGEAMVEKEEPGTGSIV